MRLQHVTIVGYRSIRKSFDLDLDNRITVFLGANDHGKTNLLNAILHLNADHPFSNDGDLNLDHTNRETKFPDIRYVLRLSDDERAELLKRETIRIRTETIGDFREHLQHEADAASEAAQRHAEEEAAHLAELENQPDEASEGTEGAIAADLAAAAEREAQESAAAVDLAAKRAALARAEELRILADIEGEEFDLSTTAEEAEAKAGKATTNTKRAETRAETARAAVQEAVSTHGEGSEEAQKAEHDAANAEQQAEQAQRESDRLAKEAGDVRAAAEAEALAEEGQLRFGKEAPLPKPRLPRLDDVPEMITVGRIGLEGELKLIDSGSFGGNAAMEYVQQKIPRVELFAPQESLPDMATLESIGEEGNDFMRGIFWYAGLSPHEREGIFVQDDATMKRLAAANDQLNETLRDSWSQGRELQFKLQHHEGEIDLLIDDPAVTARYVRASRRSSGFTHFFALKTMLNAREHESGASSFIWLFDDPGIYLHPEGQHDLLQVLETLAQANQILYSTHSIFLINKNYPARHRLLKKDKDGTGIDQKPFTSQWRAAIDALGLAFPGTFLFASKVLLVEGDSDPILLNADMQRLIEIGQLTIDINPLSIISTGDSKHADALVRILLDSAIKPEIALLFDGDKGGVDRRKSLKKLIESKELLKHDLQRDTSVEDHVLLPELYREATIRYLEGSPDAPKKIRAELQESWDRDIGSGTPKGIARWARSEGKRVLNEDEEPSSVGIAREYATFVGDATPEELAKASGRKRALALASKIAEMVKLAPQTVEQEQIVEEV